MKKLLLFTSTLVCCFAMPLMAEQATTEETPKAETTPQTSQPTSDEQLQGFMVRHQIDEKQISAGTQVKPDPLVLLHKLKADVAEFLEDNKPLNLKTTVTPILAERLDKELKDAPSLVLETFIDKDGQGKTEFDIPPYKHTVPEDKNGGEVSIDWQGLDGQFKYPETFELVETDLTLKGLSITEKDAFSMDLGRLAFVANLDKDLLPIKMDTKLPKLVFKDESSTLTLADLALKTEMKKTASQVEITSGKFNLGKVELGARDKTNAELKLLHLVFGGDEKDSTINLTSKLSIEHLNLSKAVAGETLELNHEMDLALNNLDAPATAQLQQTFRELQNQLHSGKISEDILNFALFGQLMQLAPAFLAKSPGLVLSNIHLNTNKGTLNGALHLGVNGQKATSLTNMMELLMAMVMQADFTIDKPLLKLALTATLGSAGQADTRIKALLKDKTLLETENNYTLSASITDNKLTLNGQDMGAPMDLFMLLMPLAIQ